MHGHHDIGPRYAIYFTLPADHGLAIVAERWLRREGRRTAPLVGLEDIRRQRDLVAGPRRYGFHATLKPPFHLREGRSRDELIAAVEAYAGTVRPVPIGPLRIDIVRGSFALVPRHDAPYLRSFASRIVTEFDSFRAPMGSHELQRRMARPLEERELINLVTFGYPYVLDRYDFRFRLTGRICPGEAQAVRQSLEDAFQGALDDDLRMDAVTLSEQQRPQSGFATVRRFALGASVLQPHEGAEVRSIQFASRYVG